MRRSLPLGTEPIHTAYKPGSSIITRYRNWHPA